MVSCLGSLVQSCCGEGGALQANVTDLCGEHSQCSGHTGFAPLMAHVLSPSTLLRLQAALQGAGPVWRALPRPKPLRFRFSGPPQGCRLGWACVLCLPRPKQLRQLEHTLPRCSAPSPSLSQPQFPHAHHCGAPFVSSGELISCCDPPGGCQPSRISGSLWLEIGLLFAVW